MNKLLIIGARGFGREVYNLFLDCKASLGDVECKGFLDDKADALDGYADYPPIISSVEDYDVKPEDLFICALGDVNYKKLYVDKILAKGGRFITLIHPSVAIGSNTTIGSGCIILNNTSISCDVNIGDFVTVMHSVVIGHDSSVGLGSHIGTMTFMGGFSSVGSMVTTHPGVKLLPHKQIGDGSTAGAGSIVISNVKPGITVFGSPARKLTF